MYYAHDEEIGSPSQTCYSQSQNATMKRDSDSVSLSRHSPINHIAEASPKTDGLQQKDGTLRGMSATTPNLKEVTSGAKHAAETERKMAFMEGLRLYPMAVFFSFALSLAVVMEGYDTALLANFYGIPAFAKKYGSLAMVNGVETYQVSAAWQSGLTNGQQCGQIIGLFINGFVSERIGYRKMMLGCLVFVSGTIFITFFAVNVHMLLAGVLLCGLPWGAFQTLTTTYAADVTPVVLRPYLTTYVNLCWVIGSLIGSGVLRGFLDNTTQWAYRIPFGIQWMWPLPIFVVCWFAPESPWWLIRHGKLDQARATLLRLTSNENPDFNVEDSLAMMIHTNELELHQTAGTSFLDCFKGVNLRRTELTVMTWALQQTCGSGMMGWGTYFLLQVGLSSQSAYNLSIGQNAMGFVGTIVSGFLMPHIGRRTLYLVGQIGMLIILLTIGGLGVPGISSSTGWATGALLLVLTFVYDITVGPVCYSLVAELPSTRLRIKTVVLARNVYNILGIAVGTLQPHFMNPTSWNWQGKTAFFLASTCFLGLIWTYFRLPEPKGLTYADLDILFENKVSARNFRRVHIDPYRSGHLVVADTENVEAGHEELHR
ncbi:hypothetical protein PV08_08579 [Exophiala spinifera]|uniref:Major facilitator superfamily (MFS) profile domain-containing protein n=1 Tax=Exophiala spinifera TaxID=91928 RepID=A0A0D1YE70_9EURO|nr:uncharacterized protein PV08_08579 [Exophiala spinifera]KIW13391.1 hypothetical protein PV08_08579 [Exophiala spinifera]